MNILPAEITTDKQVKSKKRVTDHGEVFTNQREVNAMLDLVKDQAESIESRFLEPACGNGNFLAEVLRRKLNKVDQRYSKSQGEWELYAVIAISTIYGVDILEDNAQECRERLFTIFDERYTNLFKDKCKDKCRRSIKFLFSRNILWGDALNLMVPDNSQTPIVFSEWSFVKTNVIRKDYTLRKLLNHRNYQSDSLFSDQGEDVVIPTPVKEFPLIHFLALGEDECVE